MSATAVTNVRQRAGVQVRGLRAGYSVVRALVPVGHRVIVDGLDLDLPGGEITGIVGGNGSGKSTLMRAIVDPHQRISGSVRSGEGSIKVGEVAYMPQGSASTLSPWLTGYDEVSLALRIRGLSKQDCCDAADQMCADLGLAVPLARNVQELSGGQRVKVAILRALAVPEYKLLALDEPFEGLDHEARRSLIVVIRRVAQRGVPVLVTSHRDEDLRELAARVVQIDGVPIMQLRETQDHRQPECATETAPYSRPTDNGHGDALESGLVTQSSERQRARHAAFALGLLGITAGAVVWWMLAMAVGNPGLLPGPIPVARGGLRLLSEPELRPHFAASMLRAIGGWLLANITAVPLGVLLGYNRSCFQATSPWLAIGRSAPIFVLVAPAAGLFPQLPEFQRMFLIWLTLFLISLQAVSVAAAMIPRRRVDLARLYGASYWFRLRHVVFRESIGGTFSALEITLPVAIIVTLVVESFLIPPTGLALYVFNRLYDPDLSMLFAHILLPGIIAAVGLALIRRLAGAFRYDL